MSRSGFFAFFALPSPARPLGDIARMLTVWESRRRMRADLARLDRHLLRDIGIDAARARDEAAKPFWRV